MRRATAIALLAAFVAGLAAGCSKSGTDSAPDACLAGPAAYIQALEPAPNGEVRLRGETPISDCLTEGQSGGELAQVGSAMVAAATRLNQQALRDPGGPDAVRLGFLVGAANRGAEKTGGIHTDLLRRLESAAHYTPSGSRDPEIEAGFERGYAAGQESG